MQEEENFALQGQACTLVRAHVRQVRTALTGAESAVKTPGRLLEARALRQPGGANCAFTLMLLEDAKIRKPV